MYAASYWNETYNLLARSINVITSAVAVAASSSRGSIRTFNFNFNLKSLRPMGGPPTISKEVRLTSRGESSGLNRCWEFSRISFDFSTKDLSKFQLVQTTNYSIYRMVRNRSRFVCFASFCLSIDPRVKEISREWKSWHFENGRISSKVRDLNESFCRRRSIAERATSQGSPGSSVPDSEADGHCWDLPLGPRLLVIAHIVCGEEKQSQHDREWRENA